MGRLRGRAGGAPAVTALALAAVPLLVSGADAGGVAQLASGAAAESEQAPESSATTSDVLVTGPANAALTASPVPATSVRIETAGAVNPGEIPGTALQAYRRAADIIEYVAPSCTLSWPLLAAMGEVGSQHGEQAGARMRSDGAVTPDLVGPALDGRGDRPEVPDTDAGDLDGDVEWDRGVGPMHVLPGVWSLAGVDGDGDGTRSPHDIDDAALAAAVYLCATDADLSVFEEAAAALRSYYDSEAYAARVLAVAAVYEAGDYEAGNYEVPEPPKISSIGGLLNYGEGVQAASSQALEKVVRGVEKRADRVDRVVANTPSSTTGADAEPVPGKATPETPGGVDGTDRPAQPGTGNPPDAPPPTQGPGTPAGTPTETPTETPSEAPAEETPTGEVPVEEPAEEPTEEPVVEEPVVDEPVTGVWGACETGYCVDGAAVVLGISDLTVPAAGDLDYDGVTGTVAEELDSLVGQTVDLAVLPGSSPFVVLTVNDWPLV